MATAWRKLRRRKRQDETPLLLSTPTQTSAAAAAVAARAVQQQGEEEQTMMSVGKRKTNHPSIIQKKRTSKNNGPLLSSNPKDSSFRKSRQTNNHSIRRKDPPASASALSASAVHFEEKKEEIISVHHQHNDDNLSESYASPSSNQRSSLLLLEDEGLFFGSSSASSSLLTGRKSSHHEMITTTTTPLGTHSSSPWVVQMSAPEWDQEQWKYRIVVQKRSPENPSFTTAIVWRTLHDFQWLAQALMEEYHGSLLLPPLPIAVTTQVVTDSGPLRIWLANLLNGQRHNLILPYARNNNNWVAQSTSMETFLYHAAKESLERVIPHKNGPTTTRSSTDKKQPSWKWWSWDLLCGAPTQEEPLVWSQKYSSRALLATRLGSTPSWLGQDSILSGGASPRHNDDDDTDDDTIGHGRAILVDRHQKSLQLLNRVAHCQRAETEWATSWQRFAVSLVNLFAAEKALEGLKPRVSLPLRKIQKLETPMKRFCKAKMERSSCSWTQLTCRLEPFVVDWSAVEPSVSLFQKKQQEEDESETNSQYRDWMEESLQALVEASPFDQVQTEFWQTEEQQAKTLKDASRNLTRELVPPHKDQLAKMVERHLADEKLDQTNEIQLVERILQLGSNNNPKSERGVLDLAKERVGRWNDDLAIQIMKALRIENPNVPVGETTRELRHVRKHAIALRESAERCREKVKLLSSGCPRSVRCEVFGKYLAPLLRTDARAMRYMEMRESQADWLVTSLADLVEDYFLRIEALESFVFYECVGIQLETHFSRERTRMLEDLQKRTDLVSALNVAQRKKLPVVPELQGRLEGMSNVTHSHVRQAKDIHMLSKNIKAELHDLAQRRLVRVREASTERVIAIMAMWAKEEEACAKAELKVLNEIISSEVPTLSEA